MTAVGWAQIALYFLVLLLLIKPDVHCKGTDYTVDTVPERAVVQSYGGRTAIVGDAKHHATRELVARIARK